MPVFAVLLAIIFFPAVVVVVITVVSISVVVAVTVVVVLIVVVVVEVGVVVVIVVEIVCKSGTSRRLFWGKKSSNFMVWGPSLS